MLWLCVILVGVLVTVADVFLFAKDKRVATCVHAFFRDAVTVNLVSFFLMKNIFNVENIFGASTHGPWYLLKYAVLSVAVGIVFLCVLGFIKNILQFEYEEPKHEKGAMAVKIISTVFFALGVAAFTGTIWGKEAFGDLSPDQILINLNSPTEGTDVGVYISLFEGPVLITALLTALFCIIVFSKYKLTYQKNEKKSTILSAVAIRVLCFLLAITILVGGCAFGIERFQLMTLFSAYFNDSPYIEENFVDPNKANLKFPEHKRNLIHIYLESMENTYFSKDLGGYFDENLMPDLAELCKEGYSFSHLDKGFGGPPTSTGGNWSIASMVNMNTGLPMKVPFDHNAYGTKDNFLPGATTLGDILEEQGYEQSVMFGAEAAFGGLNFYFESHGNFCSGGKGLQIGVVEHETQIFLCQFADIYHFCSFPPGASCASGIVIASLNFLAVCEIILTDLWRVYLWLIMTKKCSIVFLRTSCSFFPKKSPKRLRRRTIFWK